MKNTYHFYGQATYDFAISIDADSEEQARQLLTSHVYHDSGYNLDIDVHGCDVEEDTGDAADPTGAQS